MGRILGTGLKRRIAEDLNGIQVNFCHNANCVNFGVPGAQNSKDPNYTISGTGKSTSGIKCRACGRITSIKSNHAIHEEIKRYTIPDYLSRPVRHKGHSCPNSNCDNFLKPLANSPTEYAKRGFTSSGNAKHQCKRCRKMFTVGSTKHLAQTVNKRRRTQAVMEQLVNGTGIRRMAELTGLSTPAIYKKIDLIFERCVLFSLERERQLPGLTLNSMRLCTDRQDYLVNWSNRKDKRTMQLTAIGTADTDSRYVFGMEVNFDPAIQMHELLETPSYKNDIGLHHHNRAYARIWTPDEIKPPKPAKEKAQTGSFVMDELCTIAEYTKGDKNLLEIGVENQLPQAGVLVHSEYTQYAHFMRLAEMIGHAPELVFYTDLESGIGNAINLAFQDKMNQSAAHHLLVKYDKELTVDERRKLTRQAKAVAKGIMANFNCTRREAEQAMVSESLLSKFKLKGVTGTWYRHPVDTVAESNKFISFSKELSKEDWGLKTRLAHEASTQPIDSFFQQVRRRLSMLERPIASVSANRRVWTGKSPYNPEMIYKTLQIFRTYHNYCLKSAADKRTPAERLGLAKGKVEIRRIIY